MEVEPCAWLQLGMEVVAVQNDYFYSHVNVETRLTIVDFGLIDHLDCCSVAVHHWVDNDEKLKDDTPEVADQMDGKNFLDDEIDLGVDPSHYDEELPVALHNDDHIHDEEVVERARKEDSLEVVDFEMNGVDNNLKC